MRSWLKNLEEIDLDCVLQYEYLLGRQLTGRDEYLEIDKQVDEMVLEFQNRKDFFAAYPELARYKAPAGPKWKLWFEVYNDRGVKTGAGVRHEEYAHKSSALRKVTQLDQKHHLWFVSQTNPWEHADPMLAESRVQFLSRLVGKEVLVYEEDAENRYGKFFDVATPQECADLFGKPVWDGQKMFFPVEVQPEMGCEADKFVPLEEQIGAAEAVRYNVIRDDKNTAIYNER